MAHLFVCGVFNTSIYIDAFQQYATAIESLIVENPTAEGFSGPKT